MRSCRTPAIILGATLLLATAAAAGDDPATLFRRAEWERHVSTILAQQEALKRIPSHEPVYDVTFYDLSVRLDPSDSTLVGTVWVRARSLVDTLGSVDLDLFDSLVVDSVGGDGISFTHGGGILSIALGGRFDPGEDLAVRVDYHGKPLPYRRNGLIWKTHGSHPIVYSMVEPFFSNYWWPCKDVPWDKADSAQVTITFPVGLAGVSNGVHVRTVQAEEGWLSTTWIHRHPIPPYLIMVALSNYELLADVYDNGVDPEVTIAHWVFPEDRVPAETTFALVPEMMGRLETLYGPYPYREERFGHAEVAGSGAMEHNTCVSFGASLIVGNRGSDGVIVHELGHQWWGDLVTCADWNDIWLNEGFATYTEALWAEHRAGPSALRTFMTRQEYHGEQSVYVAPVPDLDSLFTARYYRAIYDKGGWVLHMLRREVGDRTFLDILERHKTESLARGGIATTAEFQTTCESASGLDLDRFFRQWVYLSGSPEFTLEPFVSPSGDSLWLRIAQDPEQDTCFATKIEVMVERAGRADTMLVVPVASWADTFTAALGGTIEGVRCDEDNWLLDRGFSGPVDSVLSIVEGDDLELLWEIDDPFVTGVYLYSGPTAGGPWTPAQQPPAVLPPDGSFRTERPTQTLYFVLRAVSDSLPGYLSTPSNVVESSMPSETETLTDSTATNPYILGGEPYGVRFNLAQAGNVSIRVYDITGRLVRTVFDDHLASGFDHRKEWDGKNEEGRTVAPGVYLVRFDTEEYGVTRKVVVLK